MPHLPLQETFHQWSHLTTLSTLLRMPYRMFHSPRSYPLLLTGRRFERWTLRWPFRLLIQHSHHCTGHQQFNWMMRRPYHPPPQRPGPALILPCQASRQPAHHVLNRPLCLPYCLVFQCMYRIVLRYCRLVHLTYRRPVQLPSHRPSR